MKITQQHIKEARKVYNLYWDSYQGGDLDAFASTLGEHFEMIGTSESEICHSKEDGIEFYKGQLEELVGKAEMRYRHINEIPHDDQVLINEICDIYTFLDSEWTFYSKLRISTLLRETSSGWKVVQQHCSFPDLRVQEGETLAIEKITKENLALRDAVKRRTAELENKNRELEIEAALERVRAIAMGMTKPDDMLDVCRVISDQLQQFGVKHIRNIQTAIIDEKIGRYLCYQYFTPYEKTTIEDTVYHKSPVEHAMVKKMLASRDERFIGTLAGKELDEFRSHRKEVNQFPDPLLDESSELNYCFLSIGEGGLGLSLYQALSQDVLSLFGRFHQVFTLAYRRFRDIEKAEAQARESEIQLALERVRARTMAMQNSDELTEASLVLDEQVRSLGIHTWGSAFHIYADDPEGDYEWFSSREGTLPFYKTPRKEFFLKFYEKGKAGETFHVEEFIGEDCEDHYEYLMTLPVIGDALQEIVDAGASLPDSQYDHVAFFKHGYVLFITYEPVPDAHDIFQRFSQVFEQTYTRFLDLQKAEAQARGAQIETALERVRSRSMAMQKSEELGEVVRQINEEIMELGIDINNTQIGTDFTSEPHNGFNDWVSVEGQQYLEKFHIPFIDHPVTAKFYETLESDLGCFTAKYSKSEKNAYFKLLFEYSDFKDTPEKRKNYILNTPGWVICGVISKNSSMQFARYSLEKFSPEEIEVFKRFGTVFEQAYTRFLDLKKAESQAREAQIEAALERVRARSMGMQKSDELIEVVRKIGKGIHELGIQIHYSQIFTDYSHDPKTGINIWVDVEGLNYLEKFHIPYIDHLITQRFYNPLNKGLDFSDNQFSKSDKDSYFKLLFKHSDLKRIPEKRKELILEAPGWTRVTVILENSSLNFGRYSLDEFTNDEKEIFKRVGKVFGQAYTRFLDLQKAEKQAREAQIENALEKVRSRSLAMQHPDELIEVAQLLREEMGALGVEELETSSIYIYDDISGLTQCWFTIKDSNDPDMSVTDQMSIDLKDTWVGRQMNEFYRSNQDKTSILMKGEKRIEWIRYCEEKSDLFGNSEFYGEIIPERTYHLYKFSNGFLGAASPGNISDESWDLMKRATFVFSFAYTRFNDLQKAEESALRAKQQASLDRIRADISSMRTADDLNRVTPLVWRELTTLGIPFIRCGVFIIHKEEEQVEVYLSKPDGTSLAVMHLPFGSSDLAIQTVNAWEKGTVSTQHWTQAEFLEWGRSMVEQGQVPDMESYQGAEEAPESLHLHFLPFNQGMLYVGSTVALNEEEIHLSESLSEAFSIAYARYEDFVKLEKAKAGIENALSDLKATQSQLVQQEKLASLGQLTAGIAHEIKNPLNFVNNFSELSVELLEEVREELSGVSNQLSADDRDKVDEAVEILYDIETNLKTIHKHGSRADSIVKSMLQHSRGGDGKMEPTPLNPLIKEYVNLAFHGMRAGKDPINVDIDLQLDEIVDEIPLIAEDFSRVILNLVNNAFDAMREKINETSKVKSEKFLRQPAEGASPSGEGELGDVTEYSYQPKLTVRTHQTEKNVIVEIEDNGPGISDEMKDKIMQPFFTTKKGTDGTGLGLSITNDIIKAHAGKLEIYSKDQRTIISLTISK